MKIFFQKIKTFIKLQHSRWTYKKSFQKIAKDADVLSIAEEGMEDYFAQLKIYLNELLEY